MAAGLGFKTFTTGEVLTAADTNGYLMQGVLVFASAAARDAAITSPQEGQFAYLKDTDATTYYSGSAWTATGAAAPSYTAINAGGTALTGAATITVSGISAKNNLFIFVFGASSASTQSRLSLKLNASATGYAYAAVTNLSSSNDASDSNSDTSYSLCRLSTDAASTASMAINVAGANGAVYKIIQHNSDVRTPGSSWEAAQGGGYWSGAASVTSVSITSSVGNFDAGTIYVFGA